MGNVVSAGIGQAPARQASKFAGLPDKTVCNTINKGKGERCVTQSTLMGGGRGRNTVNKVRVRVRACM